MENKLELKHVIPYVSYGLKLFYKGSNGSINSMGDTTIDDPDFTGDIVQINAKDKYVVCDSDYEKGIELYISCIKPILRPLSDLTSEISHNDRTFVPYSIILCQYNDQCFSTNSAGKILMYIDGSWRDVLEWPFDLVCQLISWHFDVFSLIPAGLAISYKEAGL